MPAVGPDDGGMSVPAGPLLRADLLAAGYRDDEVRRLCDTRGLVSVRPGAYVDPADRLLQHPQGRHTLAVAAAAAQLGPGVIISHVSAAVLHGITVWGVPFDRVHVTRPGSAGGRRSRHLHLHVTALDDDEVGLVDGVAVTSAVRTAADLLRALPFEQAVVVADSALHRGAVTVAGIDAALAGAPRRHGTAAARRALVFADGRSESVGESRSRVRIHLAGIPAPDLQVRVVDAEGRELGRTDFGWREHGVVGEFDGRVKFGRLLRPGQDAGDAVFAEKVREDAIRDCGTRMVRWIWRELEPFDAVARRVRRALDAAG